MQQNPYQPPVAAGVDMTASGLSTGSYEFNDLENATIAKIGSRAWWWGLVSVITGGLGLLALAALFMVMDELNLGGLSSTVITAVVVGLAPVVITQIVIAFNYMGAGSSLKQVVQTQGNDVEHLMRSLHKLGTAFMVEFMITILAMVVGFGAGIYLVSNNVDVSGSGDDIDFNF